MLAAAVGCAQSRNYTPKPLALNVVLSGLPSNRVQVEVADLRADRSGSEGLSDALKTQIGKALAAPDGGSSSAPTKLLVDVVEHRAFMSMVDWNGITRLRARLVSPNGVVAGPWDAVGTAKRGNAWGSVTAKYVSRDAYAAAVADLFSTLHAQSLTPAR